jgi:hypothetical protein
MYIQHLNALNPCGAVIIKNLQICRLYLVQEAELVYGPAEHVYYISLANGSVARAVGADGGGARRGAAGRVPVAGGGGASMPGLDDPIGCISLLCAGSAPNIASIFSVIGIAAEGIEVCGCTAREGWLKKSENGSSNTLCCAATDGAVIGGRAGGAEKSKRSSSEATGGATGPPVLFRGGNGGGAAPVGPPGCRPGITVVTVCDCVTPP